MISNHKSEVLMKLYYSRFLSGHLTTFLQRLHHDQSRSPHDERVSFAGRWGILPMRSRIDPEGIRNYGLMRWQRPGKNTK
jgi:hypothetical protein